MFDLPDHMPGFFEVHSTYAQKIHDLWWIVLSLCVGDSFRKRALMTNTRPFLAFIATAKTSES